jgi:pimeloyl-ACP methyl ester carboxylesterase
LGGLIGLRWACADLSVPSLILWGQQNQFAPVAGAHRFERELPDTRPVVIDRAGHSCGTKFRRPAPRR